MVIPLRKLLPASSTSNSRRRQLWLALVGCRVLLPLTHYPLVLTLLSPQPPFSGCADTPPQNLPQPTSLPQPIPIDPPDGPLPPSFPSLPNSSEVLPSSSGTHPSRSPVSVPSSESLLSIAPLRSLEDHDFA
ncbi:hypothetical protein Nepgr_017478 [Nepenthes gracilis]|uniref:Uncharacterized protein n=1 Tax=Nepenthes gracilis TaxID=150966 RepID=A0AAD3SR63_NEPGR|nr:hypothetical protein Nepgr_017478 [Nepenthes gracilis]